MDKVTVYVGDSVLIKLKDGTAFESVIKGVNFESLLMWDNRVVMFDDIDRMELL